MTTSLGRMKSWHMIALSVVMACSQERQAGVASGPLPASSVQPAAAGLGPTLLASGSGGAADAAGGGAPASSPVLQDDRDAGSDELDDAGPAAAPGGDAVPGDYAVGTSRIEVTVSRARTLPVQIWYPAVESARGAARPVSEFEPAGATRELLTEILAEAPDACTSKTQHAADSPDVSTGPSSFPLVIISHCHSGARFSLFTAAEKLASLGFVVVAPDHVGDTIYEQAANRPGATDTNQLLLRTDDLSAVLDHVLDAADSSMPAGLRGKLDPERIAVVGHSFGAITAGLSTSRDPRLKASVFIAAPPTFPILSPTVLADLKTPALFFYASEDNSLPTIVNDLIKSDYESYARQAWLLEVADAGHWSFTDIPGILPALSAGCGTAMRQTRPLARFDYLEPAVGRELTVRYVAAFLERVLLGRAGPELEVAQPAAVVTLSHHP